MGMQVVTGAGILIKIQKCRRNSTSTEGNGQIRLRVETKTRFKVRGETFKRDLMRMFSHRMTISGMSFQRK